MSEPQFMLVEEVPFDIDGVSEILRKADPVCLPANLEGEFDPYELAGYRFEEKLHSTKVVFILDLNVLRRINSFHPSAKQVPIGEQERVAAAFMALAIYANTLLEPGLALNEWFLPHVHDKVEQELLRFQQLDNVMPDVFAAIALGKLDRLSVDHLGQVQAKSTPPSPSA